MAARPWGVTSRPYDDTGIEFGRTGGLGQGFAEPGFTGPFAARTTGYTPVRWSDKTIHTTVSGGVFSPGGEATDGTRFTVPPGTAGAIVQTSTSDDNSNIDLCVYRDGGLIDRGATSCPAC